MEGAGTCAVLQEDVEEVDLPAGGAGCCLQITGMKVPRMVVTGESIQLSCSFRLDGAQLYTLTWWKDSHIFYKFNPKRSPPSVVFPLPGITVDVSLSISYVSLMSPLVLRILIIFFL